MPILTNARHSAGYKPTSSSGAYANAARLVRNDKVRARLSELQSKEEFKSLLTMERHMEELRVIREMAKEKGQFASAIRAEELRGKLRGFYVDQVQHRDAHGFEQMTDEQLREYIVREAAALGFIKPTNGVGKQSSQGAKTLRDR